MRAALASVLSLATAAAATLVTGLTPAHSASRSAPAQPMTGPIAHLTATAYPAAGARPAPRTVAYAMPVAPPARVLAPFVAPRTTYSAGHRGVDLAVPRRGPVLAAATGVVRFAGQIAGRGVVVLLHADGIATEYEPVRPAVRVGARVAGGALIGTVLGQHRTCPRDGCVHWSARRGTAYLDPMALLEALGPVRLIPWRETT